MRFFCFSLLFAIVFSCSNNETHRSKLIHFIPNNASVILRTNNIEDLRISIQNNNLFKDIAKTKAYVNLDKKLKDLTLFKPKGELLLCFWKDSLDSLQYAFITKYNKSLFITDSLKNYIEETLLFDGKSIKKSNFNDNIFYSSIIDSTFFASSSKASVELAYTKTPIDIELEKIYNATSPDKTASVILKSNNPFIKSLFPFEILPFKTLSSYIAVDIDISQNQILINGVAKTLNETEGFINAFKNTSPQENQLQNITPNNSDGYLSITFDNFKNLERNLKELSEKDSITDSKGLFDNINEVGVIYEGNYRAIILNSLDVIGTKDALLGEINPLESYREVDIFSFSRPSLFFETFSPFIKFNNATKYCTLDNFFVFADNLELIQNIISNYQNKTTLSEQSYFKKTKENISNASSLMIAVNPSILKNILETNLNENLSSDLSDYNTSVLQFVFDRHFAHVNGILRASKVKVSENSVSEEINIKLDADLLNNPQFVTNHITGEKEIVVQDVKNNLYLISNKGKILWKKQLLGAVLGTIEQIDIYKNGRLQLAFATPHRVYLLDRNGNDVAPFPGKFNDNITQPLSVFDYDKNKNYRLLVTQGKNLLMYDTQAKLVSGFTFKTANRNVINQPQHIRVGTRDYIIFKTESKLYILDRVGKIRINPKSLVTYSNKPIFYYNDNFITTTRNGDLVSVDSNGKVSSQNLNLGTNHGLDASSKTLVTHSENRLTIKGKTIELDYGTYSEPKLFYLNDKIYVTITDLLAHKTYLFDSQGDPINNFPVYGNSSIFLDNIDSDRNLELVTKGDSNAIILYEIN